MDFVGLGTARDTHSYRIYGSDDLETFATVDAQDYTILCRYRWLPLVSRTGGNVYLKRKISVRHAPDGAKYESPITGKIVRGENRTQFSVFLHHQVMELWGKPRPSPDHILDHANGNGLDCRRKNLRWVSTVFNWHNKHGALAHVDPHDFERMVGVWQAEHPKARSALIRSWARSLRSPQTSSSSLVLP